MAKTEQFVTDEQWAKIEPLLPVYKPSPKGGRQRRGNREVFEGIAWVLRSGARWKDLPRRYPSPSTCWRRLNEWEETFADGSFAPAKKGGAVSVRPNAERVRSGWWWSMARESLSVLILIRPRRVR